MQDLSSFYLTSNLAGVLDNLSEHRPAADLTEDMGLPG